MATFVLVHGAWQGGWCWKRVATRLRQLGHEVFTPTMTGLGERAHLLDEKIDLDTHIQDILGVIRCEELSDIVLCGHSYGGMVITGVADTVPEQISALVYLDALLPTDGQNVLDLLPVEAANDFREVARTTGSGYRVAPGAAEAFGVNPQDQAWVDRQCVDHPFKTFKQPIHQEDNWKHVDQLIYILAAGWSPGVGSPFFEKVRQEPGWGAISLPCGNDLMFDMPQELTDLLLTAI